MKSMQTLESVRVSCFSISRHKNNQIIFRDMRIICYIRLIHLNESFRFIEFVETINVQMQNKGFIKRIIEIQIEY